MMTQIGNYMYQGLATTGGTGIVLLFLGQYISLSYMTLASVAVLLMIVGVVIWFTSRRSIAHAYQARHANTRSKKRRR
jgi:uncharacterized membrane-anchored protein